MWRPRFPTAARDARIATDEVKIMTNRIKPLVGSALAALLLAGCAYEGGYHHGYASMDVDYDGYYDGAYGPINDGYWGQDGVFYYSDGPGHPFRRDDAHHVRRDPTSGYQALHGHHTGSAGDDHHDR
jgi:hypothetical protein